MKKISFILLMFLPLTIFCQNSERKFSIGLNFSPDYCYRSLMSDASLKSVVKNRDSLEIPKVGFTFGLNMMYEFNSRLSIEAGIQFSDKGEKTKWIELYLIQPDPLIPQKEYTAYKYQYLDIPLKADYYILNKGLKLFISAGVSTNIFLKEQDKSFKKYSDGTSKTSSSTNTIYNFNAVNFAILAGIGMDYDFIGKIRFRIEPIYRRSINTIINTPVKSYLYSAGLNIGVYYKI